MLKHIKINKNNLEYAIEITKELFPNRDAKPYYEGAVSGENDYNFFLVYNGDDCVGLSGIYHVGADYENGFLGFFGILPKYRRESLGSDALRLLDETARDLGFRTMRALVNKTLDDEGVIPFLKANGYSLEEYYNPRDKASLNHDYIIMSKSLFQEPINPWNNKNLHISENQ